MQATELHPAVDLAEARLRAHVQRFLPKAKVWLFGSRATHKARRRSDFDLAVELGETPETALADLEEAIQDDPEIIYAVDVIDLRNAPDFLREKVQKEGILWTN